MSYKNIASSVELNGWIAYLRNRLPYSFLYIKEIKRNRKKFYELNEPFLEGDSPFPCGYNLWRRALTFYSAGKLIDAFELMAVFRNAATRITDMAKSGSVVFPREVWDLAQFEKLSIRLNRSRLDCERP